MQNEPRHRRCLVTGLAGIFLSALLSVTAGAAEQGLMTVYIAKRIITMEPALPEATAVAVADGRIVSVGTLDSLEPWTRDREMTIDRTFEDKILMPGFIDPHLHPSLPAVLTQFAFLAPDDWYLPTGDFPGAKTPSEFAARLKQFGDAYFPIPIATRPFPSSPGAITNCGMARSIARNSTSCSATAQ